MIKNFFNKRAAVWDEKYTENDRNKLKEISEFVSIPSGGIVLDAGAGTGTFVPFLLEKIGDSGSLTCMDIADEMLKRCREKYSNTNIQFICADISACGLPDSQFDVVVCYSSFPHFQDKPKALAEIFRILKNKGKVYICHSSGREFINNIHSSIPEVKHDLLPGPTEMRCLLRETGFSNIQIIEDDTKYLVSAEK